MRKPKLVLSGFMATGKSTVARILARRLGWALVDSDEELVRRSGKSIAQIFAQDGEGLFRQLERTLIAELAADPHPAVIATGGGALADERNFRALSRAGLIVCLSARPDAIARRIGRSAKDRPKLLEGGKPLKERIAQLIAERRQAYARADLTIDTSGLTAEEVAERVLSVLEKRGGRRCAPLA